MQRHGVGGGCVFFSESDIAAGDSREQAVLYASQHMIYRSTCPLLLFLFQVDEKKKMIIVPMTRRREYLYIIDLVWNFDDGVWQSF